MPTLRYFAAAAEAAGTTQEVIEGPDVAAVLAATCNAHGPQMSHVVGHSSLLLDGHYVSDHDTPLSAGAVLDVLPPFAGG